MYKAAIIAAAVAGSATAEKREFKNQLVLQSEEQVGEVVRTKRPHEYLKASEHAWL